MRQLPAWIAHYNEIHPQLSDIIHPVSSSQLAEVPDRVRLFGATTCYSTDLLYLS
jgi:hypothetical protein